jgi:hypothetical protein
MCGVKLLFWDCRKLYSSSLVLQPPLTPRFCSFRSTFYGKNTIHTRWQLRDQLEKRSLAINAEFLQAFSAIETVRLFRLSSLELL